MAALDDLKAAIDKLSADVAAHLAAQVPAAATEADLTALTDSVNAIDATVAVAAA